MIPYPKLIFRSSTGSSSSISKRAAGRIPELKVWRGEATEDELDRYDRQRRLVTLDYIQNQTIRNKQNMESEGEDFIRELQSVAADKARARDYLVRVSMIASLRRASELG